jgi:hypothetical protein
MIKRLRVGFIVIASVMLLLLGFSGQDEARGQDDLCVDCLCPGIDFTTGWFDIAISFPNPDLDFADFTAGLLGTIESLGAGQPNIGGLDWLYQDSSEENTTIIGSQLVSWWSQKNLRNTYLQVTNLIGFCAFNGEVINFPFGIPCYGVQDCPDPTDPRFSCIGPNLEVKFLDEACVEITNFCDPYTPGDTHVYNLGDLIDNNGIPRNDAVLQGKEGVFVVTPVNNCEEEIPISWNFLDGNLRLFDLGNDTDYGTNIYARRVEDFLFECRFPTFFVGGDCVYQFVGPSQLKQNFFQVPFSAASAADLVLISFIDNYNLPPFAFIPYAVVPGDTLFTPDDFCNDIEQCESCTPQRGCFVRTGLDDPFPISEDFAPPTPTPTPTPTVTAIPCTSDADCPAGFECEFLDQPSGFCVPIPPTPTATPTSTPGPGGGDGCDIAGAPVQLGTAMANILIPLVPAFAIGYRIIRRRDRKEGK